MFIPMKLGEVFAQNARLLFDGVRSEVACFFGFPMSHDTEASFQPVEMGFSFSLSCPMSKRIKHV